MSRPIANAYDALSEIARGESLDAIRPRLQISDAEAWSGVIHGAVAWCIRVRNARAGVHPDDLCQEQLFLLDKHVEELIVAECDVDMPGGAS